VECVLYGVGSPFVETAREAIWRLGWTVRGGVVNMETAFKPEALEPLVGADAIPSDWLDVPAIVPFTTPGHRFAVEREARGRGFQAFAILVDPTASVAHTVRLGEGAVIVNGALVGAAADVGRFALVNRGAIVSHHVTIADYATVSPGAILNGSVTVDRGAFVGAGAIVLPEITIGANAVVGAGALVRTDVAAHTLVIGHPAKVAREGIPGFSEATVPSAARPAASEGG
jgi:sugar O-acyltransferase (sialic acid O-acetyltransferase NeuD family)